MVDAADTSLLCWQSVEIFNLLYVKPIMNCLSSVGSSTELHYITGGRDRHKKSEAKNMADFDAIPMATGSFWPGKYHWPG